MTPQQLNAVRSEVLRILHDWQQHYLTSRERNKLLRKYLRPDAVYMLTDAMSEFTSLDALVKACYRWVRPAQLAANFSPTSPPTDDPQKGAQASE